MRQTLHALGVEKNTLIWFVSDNGAAENKSDQFGEYGGFGSNGPFRGWKTTFYEGGIRVPAILLYPRRFPEPVVVTMPCVTSDMFPTIATILGDSETARSQPQDGMDLLPAIEGKMSYREKPIGFAYEKKGAWMTQQYKLIVGLGNDGSDGNNHAEPQLFDILADPSEKVNIAAQHPGKVQAMTLALSQWISSCNHSSGDRYKHLPLPR